MLPPTMVLIGARHARVRGRMKFDEGPRSRWTPTACIELDADLEFAYFRTGSARLEGLTLGFELDFQL